MGFFSFVIVFRWWGGVVGWCDVRECGCGDVMLGLVRGRQCCSWSRLQVYVIVCCEVRLLSRTRFVWWPTVLAMFHTRLWIRPTAMTLATPLQPGGDVYISFLIVSATCWRCLHIWVGWGQSADSDSSSCVFIFLWVRLAVLLDVDSPGGKTEALGKHETWKCDQINIQEVVQLFLLQNQSWHNYIYVVSYIVEPYSSFRCLTKS